MASGEFIGFVGLCDQAYESPFTPCTDIGWRLAPEFWGKGYATEGAKRCLEYAFNDLRLDEIKSTAPKVNVPSIRVMEKANMQAVGMTDKYHGAFLMCYEKFPNN